MMDACSHLVFLYPLSSYQPETAGTEIRAAIFYHPVSAFVPYSSANSISWVFLLEEAQLCKVISQGLGTLCVLSI